MTTPRPPSTSEAPDPFLGQVLDGRFEVRSLIARGGMGSVYRATQHPLGRIVALKLLGGRTATEGSEAAEFKARFFREARLCSRLSHPNTVRIFDYGVTSSGDYFIAMEFLEGVTLKRAIRSARPNTMETGRLLLLMRQACGALTEAHALGMVHRDLKPGNLMVSLHAGEEQLKILDFGLVKDLGEDASPEATQTGVIVGSPMYMSPEQILQEDVDPRSDIYSLGVILYEAITGKRIFERSTNMAIVSCHLSVEPPPMAERNASHGASPALEWVTMTCLKKPRSSRFRDVVELQRALEMCHREARGEISGLEMELDSDGRLVLLDYEQLSGTSITAERIQATMDPRVEQSDPGDDGAAESSPSLMQRAPAPTVVLDETSPSRSSATPPLLTAPTDRKLVTSFAVTLGVVLLFALLAALIWRTYSPRPTNELLAPDPIEDVLVAPAETVAPEITPPAPEPEAVIEAPAVPVEATPEPAPKAAKRPQPARARPSATKATPVEPEVEAPAPDEGSEPEAETVEQSGSEGSDTPEAVPAEPEPGDEESKPKSDNKDPWAND